MGPMGLARLFPQTRRTTKIQFTNIKSSIYKYTYKWYAYALRTQTPVYIHVFHPSPPAGNGIVEVCERVYV